MNRLVPPEATVRDLWSLAPFAPEALEQLALTGREPVLPSSFAVSTAAQAAVAVAALAAAELRHLRGQPRQAVRVAMRDAALECRSHFTLDGVTPDPWDKLSGLYRCGHGDGARWVRVHANFEHHRDGVLRLLGLPEGPDTERAAVERALATWDAFAFEEEAARRGLVVAAVRRFDEWDAHPQAAALAGTPLVAFERIGDAAPLAWPALAADARPLAGLRVLELTRIIAGPVAGRALAAYGADVLLVNGPHLPNISVLAETSRGKRSALVDLRGAAGRAALDRLVAGAHVFMQGYRPGSLEARGLAPQRLATLRPGIVCVSLSAYGSSGPWRERRGFDSLVQSATGFNVAEGDAAAACSGSAWAPKAMPVQILDHASGLLMAFGAQAALALQQRVGGSWHVRVSLARTGAWLRSLGRQPEGLRAPSPGIDADLLETCASGFGTLAAVRHAAQLAATPAAYVLPAMPPGTHEAVWA